MISVEQHLGRILQHRPASPVLRPRRARRAGLRPGGRRRRQRSSCPASPTRRWTGMPCTRRTSPAPARSRRSCCRSSTTSPPATPTRCSLATGPDHADHDRRAAAAGRRRRRPRRGRPTAAWCESVLATAPRPGQHVRRWARTSHAGECILRAGHPARPRADRPAGRRRRRPGAGRAAAPGRRALHRRRARRAGPRRPASARSSTPTRSCSPPRCARSGPRRTGWAGCPTTPASSWRPWRASWSGPTPSSRPAGSAMGAFDTVKEVLSRVGTMQFDKVAMRPGMPQGFGVLGEEQVPVFTLPGQPGQRAGVLPRLRRAGAARRWPGAPRAAFPPGFVPAVAAESWSSVAGQDGVRAGGHATATGCGSRVGRARTCWARWPRPTRWR